MNMGTAFLRRCIVSLRRAVEEIKWREGGDDKICDILRAAYVNEFELVLEQSGKLLRKLLAIWFASNKQADRLYFTDIVRHAARHDLIASDATERWLCYRDNRNLTAHYYGDDFAEHTPELRPAFIADAKSLADMLDRTNDE